VLSLIVLLVTVACPTRFKPPPREALFADIVLAVIVMAVPEDVATPPPQELLPARVLPLKVLDITVNAPA
jgi:hypothetical protein